MKCKNCGNSLVIPVVSGTAGDQGLRAEMLGLLRLGGVLTGTSNLWYCSSCRSEFCEEESQEHAAAVAKAIRIASESNATWLNSADAREIAIGRQVFDRLVSDFTSVGATAVLLSINGEAFARFDGDYEPMEWPLAVYGKNVIQALNVGACNTSLKNFFSNESMVEITF